MVHVVHVWFAVFKWSLDWSSVVHAQILNRHSQAGVRTCLVAPDGVSFAAITKTQNLRMIQDDKTI